MFTSIAGAWQTFSSLAGSGGGGKGVMRTRQVTKAIANKPVTKIKKNASFTLKVYFTVILSIDQFLYITPVISMCLILSLLSINKNLMINGIKLNRKTFIRWKIYIDRARMYIGYVQFFMIGLVLFESIKDQEIGKIFYQYIYISIPILFIMFIFFSLMIGYLDTKLGFKEEEQRNLSYSNPILMDILKSVKEMEKEISAIKSERSK
jgi:hypothetical protein